MPDFQLDCPNEMSWRRHCPTFSPMLEATSNHTNVPRGCAVGKLGSICCRDLRKPYGQCAAERGAACRHRMRIKAAGTCISSPARSAQDRRRRAQHTVGEFPGAAPYYLHNIKVSQTDFFQSGEVVQSREYSVFDRVRRANGGYTRVHDRRLQWLLRRNLHCRIIAYATCDIAFSAKVTRDKFTITDVQHRTQDSGAAMNLSRFLTGLWFPFCTTGPLLHRRCNPKSVNGQHQGPRSHLQNSALILTLTNPN